MPTLRGRVQKDQMVTVKCAQTIWDFRHFLKAAKECAVQMNPVNPFQWKWTLSEQSLVGTVTAEERWMECNMFLM